MTPRTTNLPPRQMLVATSTRTRSGRCLMHFDLLTRHKEKYPPNSFTKPQHTATTRSHKQSVITLDNPGLAFICNVHRAMSPVRGGMTPPPVNLSNMAEHRPAWAHKIAADLVHTDHQAPPCALIRLCTSSRCTSVSCLTRGPEGKVTAAHLEGRKRAEHNKE